MTSPPRRTLGPLALVVTALLLLVAAAGCSHGSGSDSADLTSADVQRFVLAKEATDNLAYLLNLNATADETANQLAQQQPGSAAAGRLIDGTRVGWNNVLVGLNTFSPAQAAAVHGLAATVQATRQVAIEWTNTMDKLKTGPAPRTKHAMVQMLAVPRKHELKARHYLGETAATLAKMVCSLERAHPQLAPPATATRDCENAARLSAAAGSDG